MGMGATRWKEAAIGMGWTRSQMVGRVVVSIVLPRMLDRSEAGGGPRLWGKPRPYGAPLG